MLAWWYLAEQFSQNRIAVGEIFGFKQKRCELALYALPQKSALLNSAPLNAVAAHMHLKLLAVGDFSHEVDESANNFCGFGFRKSIEERANFLEKLLQLDDVAVRDVQVP